MLLDEGRYVNMLSAAEIIEKEKARKILIDRKIEAENTVYALGIAIHSLTTEITEYYKELDKIHEEQGG